MGQNEVILFIVALSSLTHASDLLPRDSDSILESIESNNQLPNDLETNSQVKLENLNDEEFDRISNFLMKLLLIPWPNGESPLLYVEDPDRPMLNPNVQKEEEINLEDFDLRPNQLKRSKYYRKYPWKRQNSSPLPGPYGPWRPALQEALPVPMLPPMLAGKRQAQHYYYGPRNARYEPDNQYMCSPNKHDVMRLLVALHEARAGSRERLVDFCRRRRPASSVFTSVRFLGKKK